MQKIREAMGHVALKWKPSLWLDTGIPDLNCVLGHRERGIPYGRLIEISGWECVAGSTLIDCPRDLTKYPQGIPIKELVGTRPWVYGYDQEQCRIVLRQASRVWKVGRRPVYKVTFKVSKNSVRTYSRQPEFLIATAAHPFMLRERAAERSKYSPAFDRESLGYKQLSDLKPGDHLMPMMRGISSPKHLARINLNNGKRVMEHRFILSEIYGERDTDWDGHHKDERPQNNDVGNLEWKTASAHMSFHLAKRNHEGRAGWLKTGVHPRGMAGKSQTEKARIAASKFCKERSRKNEDAWIAKYDITAKRVHELYVNQKMTLPELGNVIHASYPRVNRILERFGIPKRDPYWHQKQGKLNHEVLKIEPCGYEDVYDMTVPGIDNFVANGVVVHNSQGKSSVMLAVAALAQRDGAHVVWLDVENSFDPGYAIQRGFAKCPRCEGTGKPMMGKPKMPSPGDKDCPACGGPDATTRGLDTGKLTLIQPYVGRFNYTDKTGKVRQEKNPRLASAQELCAEMEAAMSGHAKCVAVLDSIAALLTEGESLTGLEDANMRTNLDLPLFMGRLLRRWVGLAQVHNCLIILVNQLREGPVKFGDPVKTPGGNAPKFYSHVRVRVSRIPSGRIKDGGKVIGIRGVLRCLKNKAGGTENSTVGFKLLFEGPIQFMPENQLKKEVEE